MLSSLLREPVLRKLYIFTVASVLSIIMMGIFHLGVHREQARYLAIETNERAKIYICLSVQQRIRALQNEFQYMLLSASNMELRTANDAIKDNLKKVLKAVAVLEKGGVYRENVFVNLGNKEAITQKFEYKAPEKNSVILPVVEMRTNLLRLDIMRRDYLAAMKWELAKTAGTRGNLTLFHKKIAPFFQRLVENSNRLYLDSLNAYNAVEKKRKEQALFSSRISFVAIPLLILALAIITIRALREIRIIIRERSSAQASLEKTNENLESLVSDRTRELQDEIQERKNTQRELGEQAEFLFNILESLDHPFYVIDAADYSISIANSAAKQQAIGATQHCHTMTHGQMEPCSGEHHPCPLHEVIKTKRPVIVEHVHSTPDGDEVIVEIHGYPIFDDGGNVVKMIEYSLDITDKHNVQMALEKAKEYLEDKVRQRTLSLEQEVHERSRVQDELAASAEHFRLLIEGIRDIIIILDRDGMITYVSPSVKTVLGYEPNYVVGKRIDTFIPLAVNDKPVRMKTALRFLTSGGAEKHIEHMAISADGASHHMESAFQDMFAEKSIGGFLVISRDVTARKKAEAMQRRLNMVVEQNPSSIVITNIYGDIEYVNPQFEKVTGYNFREAVGQNPRILNSGLTDPVLFEEMYAALKRDEVWEGEFVNRKKSGELYTENVIIAPIKNDAGVTTHYVALKENITELKRARQQAESANKAKSEFLSRMTHELRTPLNAIIGFSDLLLEGDSNQLDSKRATQVQHIRTAGQHLLHMISEVLDLSKIESGNVSTRIEPLTAVEIIKECMTLVEQQAKARSINLTLDPEVSKLTQVNADRVRLKQVLLNLLSNAVKYNKEAGSIAITGDCDDNGVSISVTDTGIGIPADKQADLFKPFARMVDDEADIEGTGIGMAITRQLLEAMGGSIIFTSVEGAGSTFTITLPIATETCTDEAASAVFRDQPMADKTVLYVESDADRLALMRNLLTGWSDCTLVVRKTMEKGRRAIELMKPDVLIMHNDLSDDLQEIVKELKTIYPELFIVIIKEDGTAPDTDATNAILQSPLDGNALRLLFNDI